MAQAAGGTRLRGEGLPKEIVIWEILVRLPPSSLLRCRAVCRAWRHITSTRDFLLSHHDHQPSLPIVCSSEYDGEIRKNVAALDHWSTAAQLQPLARLNEYFHLAASYDGLLILSNRGIGRRSGSGTPFFVYNPATRLHAPLYCLRLFTVLGMYPHRPTGQYRLLLYRRRYRESPEDQTGCYVFALGSDQPPRYIGWEEKLSVFVDAHAPASVRDGLHWYRAYHPSQTRSEAIMVFDPIAESFWHMRAPIVSTNSNIFEMDHTLGFYSCNDAVEVVDIWVLQNYESEVWDLKYRVKLPIAEIRGKFEGHDLRWYVDVASGYSDVILLVDFHQWLFHVNTDGKLVATFQDFSVYKFRHKQSLVPHTFMTPRHCKVVDTLSII